METDEDPSKPWKSRLDQGPESWEADIFNVVGCEMYRVPSHGDVPGKVIACFRPSRSFQPITARGMPRYARALWNDVSGRDDYEVEDRSVIDLFDLLDDQTTEDAVALYLQSLGWHVVPSSVKRYTKGHEFALVHGLTRQAAVLQVKTGERWLSVAHFADHPDKVFLFQAKGLYVGASSERVELIDPQVVRGFVSDDEAPVPGAISRWVRYIRDAG